MSKSNSRNKRGADKAPEIPQAQGTAGSGSTPIPPGAGATLGSSGSPDANPSDPAADPAATALTKRISQAKTPIGKRSKTQEFSEEEQEEEDNEGAIPAPVMMLTSDPLIGPVDSGLSSDELALVNSSTTSSSTQPAHPFLDAVMAQANIPIPSNNPPRLFGIQANRHYQRLADSDQVIFQNYWEEYRKLAEKLKIEHIPVRAVRNRQWYSVNNV